MDTNFEIIEKYIYGELEGKELFNFKELLVSDNDIQHYPVALFTRKENSCISLKDQKKFKKTHKINTGKSDIYLNKIKKVKKKLKIGDNIFAIYRNK